MNAKSRWVAHIDMDAFFASVEQLTRPTLQGRPVLVGGTVVAGASYEARAWGARSAMPMSQAVRLCHGRGIVIRPRFRVYAAASARIFQVITRHAGMVEKLSVDEGFAEPAQLQNADELAARAWAQQVQRAISQETGLAASVGMASTKLDAKMASNLAKPHGITVVSAQRRKEVFTPRPVGELWGIGRVAQEKLAGVGVHTIGDFVAMDSVDVRSLLGSVGMEIQRMASGDDPRPVAPRPRAKQVSAEHTTAEPLRTRAGVWLVFDEVLRAAHARLLKDGRAARTVTVKVRTSDLQIHTRSLTLHAASDDYEVLALAARKLVHRPEDIGAIRLVGVGFSGFVDYRQEVLFPELEVADAHPETVDGDLPEQATSASRAHAEAQHRESENPQGKGSWEPTQDVTHPNYGHGWVQGSGSGVVTIRFESRRTGKGFSKTFAVDDPDVRPADPLCCLDWEDQADSDAPS